MCLAGIRAESNEPTTKFIPSGIKKIKELNGLRGGKNINNRRNNREPLVICGDAGECKQIYICDPYGNSL